MRKERFGMADAVGLHEIFKNEPCHRRIIYAFLAILAVLYLAGQIAMVVLWLTGKAQLDTL